MDLKMKQIREMRGLSQKDVADSLGIPVRRYGSWEREERKINFEDAARISDILKCTLDELAGRNYSNHEYPESNQQKLNRYYESLNEKSKDDLVGFVKSFAADPARRMVKDRKNLDDQAESIA